MKALASALFVAAFAGTALGQSFTRLGFLRTGYDPSLAFGVSSDGSTVVGESNSPQGMQAFRWRADEGMVGLGDMPGGFFSSSAYACSADGSIVVGSSDDGSAGEEGTPFIWTESQGMQRLGTLNGPTSYGQAQAMTPDASVIVGASQAPDGIFAFRWTEDTGVTSLGDFAGGVALSRAYGVSGDGSVVVGTGTVGYYYDQAFRWTAADGLAPLGSGNNALAISEDGRVIVGSDANGAYRWTAEGGFQSLALAQSGINWPLATNADGSVIVGLANFDPYNGTGNAFIWDSQRGMRDLNDVLQFTYGLDLQGMFLFSAEAISADGLVIAGYGFGPNSQEAWVANLRTGSVCTGDLDGNGTVELSDLTTLLSNYGSTSATGSQGDLDGDQDVDLTDLSSMLVAYGTNCS